MLIVGLKIGLSCLSMIWITPMILKITWTTLKTLHAASPTGVGVENGCR